MSTETSQLKILQITSKNVGLFLQKMKEQGLARNIPNISWNTAAYLIEKLQDRNISTLLEIGPANGFSTMMLALACPEAEIVSIEISRHAFEELRSNIQTYNVLQVQSAKCKVQNDGISQSSSAEADKTQNFQPANFGPKVTSDINQQKIGNHTIYYADARDILPAFKTGATEIICKNPQSIIRDIPARQFDFIFIDGAFRMTREFFDLSLPLLAPHGLIILDDAIKYRWKMDGFHEYLEETWIAYELVQTDADDGVMVIEM